MISFDKATDGGNIDTYKFQCSKLFQFYGNNVTTCNWENNDNTTVIVGEFGGTIIVPGMTLRIKSTVNIYAQCPFSSNIDHTKEVSCISPRSSSSPKVILPPLLLEKPELSVSAPSFIADCQNYR